MLRVMLSNHPDIFLCEEMLWLAPILERREEYGDLEDDDNVMRLLGDISRMLERPPGWSPPPNPRSLFGQLSDRSVAGIIRTIALSRSGGKKVRFWGDNSPPFVNAVFVLEEIFPDARYINVVRDGRDVVGSMVRGPLSFGVNMYSLAAEWNERVLGGLAAERALASERIKTVHYEQLVREPQQTLGEVCEFLDIAYDDSMLRFPESDIAATQARFPHHGNLTRPVADTSVGRYASDFSPGQIRNLERIMQMGLRSYGYPMDHPPLAPFHRRWMLRQHARSAFTQLWWESGRWLKRKLGR